MIRATAINIAAKATLVAMALIHQLSRERVWVTL